MSIYRKIDEPTGKARKFQYKGVAIGYIYTENNGGYVLSVIIKLGKILLEYKFTRMI